ncbi:MAG: hypothetical protein ABW321_10075 [Polyangiales bacterium]
MRLRLVIFASDGRGARNVALGPGKLVMGLALMLAAVSGVLWLGWKIGEFTAQF